MRRCVNLQGEEVMDIEEKLSEMGREINPGVCAEDQLEATFPHL